MAKIDLDFFEKIIFLNCLKKDSVYLASCVEYLDKQLFKNTDIGAIIGVIKDFYIERDVIPSLTELKIRINTSVLKDSLKEAVGAIKGLDITYNEEELISNTEYFLKQRKFENFLNGAIDKKVANKEFDLEEAQKENERIHGLSLVDNFGLDYFGNNEKVIEYLLQKDNFLSTGYKCVDDIFGGGLFREGRSIYGIGGQTNVGKSIIVGNIAVNVVSQVLEQKQDVIIITLEMSEMRYSKRISGMLTHIALNSLAERITDYKTYIADFIAKYRGQLWIKEFPAKAVSAKNLYAFISKLKRKKGVNPALIVLDYAPLLKSSISQPSKHSELQHIIQESRGLTYMFNCPLLTPLQLNRGSYNATSPGLDNMAGSWDMNSDFDGIANLSQTDEDREMNILRIHGKKSRDGMKGLNGIFNIDFDTLKATEEFDVPQFNDTSLTPKDLESILDFDSLTH